MSDTNDMRRDFEAWEFNQRDQTGFWPNSFQAWQAATERATASQWREISTAPKDCNILLAAEFYGPDDWRIKMGGWADDVQQWKLFGASWTPTHWMPLPTPPAIRQGGAT